MGGRAGGRPGRQAGGFMDGQGRVEGWIDRSVDWWDSRSAGRVLVEWEGWWAGAWAGWSMDQLTEREGKVALYATGTPCGTSHTCCACSPHRSLSCSL